jgi:hypothetical protein
MNRPTPQTRSFPSMISAPNEHGSHSPRNTSTHVTLNKRDSPQNVEPSSPLRFSSSSYWAATIGRVIGMPSERLTYISSSLCVSSCIANFPFRKKITSIMDNVGIYELVHIERCHCIQLRLLHGRDTTSALPALQHHSRRLRSLSQSRHGEWDCPSQAELVIYRILSDILGWCEYPSFEYITCTMTPLLFV